MHCSFCSSVSWEVSINHALKTDSHVACRAHAISLPCRYGFRMCLSHLIDTVRPCLIHTCHAVPMSCSDHAVLLKAKAQHGRLSTAMLCRGLEKNGMVRAWHGRGMASVNQTWSHCVNQTRKTHSKPLAAWHGMAGEWHEYGMLCVNRPLRAILIHQYNLFYRREVSTS